MIEGMNVYVDGTTEATVIERAREFGFDALVLDEHKGDLDVLFERDDREQFKAEAFSDERYVRGALDLLDEFAGSGCDVRATVVFAYPLYARRVREMFASSERFADAEIDTRY